MSAHVRFTPFDDWDPRAVIVAIALAQTSGDRVSGAARCDAAVKAHWHVLCLPGGSFVALRLDLGAGWGVGEAGVRSKLTMFGL